jgi:hypothetical protein
LSIYSCKEITPTKLIYSAFLILEEHFFIKSFGCKDLSIAFSFCDIYLKNINHNLSLQKQNFPSQPIYRAHKITNNPNSKFCFSTIKGTFKLHPGSYRTLQADSHPSQKLTYKYIKFLFSSQGLFDLL